MGKSIQFFPSSEIIKTCAVLQVLDINLAEDEKRDDIDFTIPIQ